MLEGDPEQPGARTKLMYDKGGRAVSPYFELSNVIAWPSQSSVTTPPFS